MMGLTETGSSRTPIGGPADRPADGAQASLQTAVDATLTALRADDLQAAQAAYNTYLTAAPGTSPTAREKTLIRALSAATAPEAGTVRVGSGPLVFGHPFRTGHTWRCGTCPGPDRADTHHGAAAALAEAADHANDHTEAGQNVTVRLLAIPTATSTDAPEKEGPGGHIRKDVRRDLPNQTPRKD